MADRLPLNGLRVFEAAARLGSFLRAAEELAITPGAVSRQIKGLEIELGVRLFERFNRAVRLTEAGATLAIGVRQGMGVMAQAVDQARTRRDAPVVISATPSLAVRWLAPRLHRFQERHPQIDIRVSASDIAVDLARAGVDIALRYGKGPYAGLSAVALASASLFPVCTPAFAAQAGLKTPADLTRVSLMQDINAFGEEPAWSDWLAAAGVEGAADERGARFSNTYLTLEAVVAGRGVALAHQALVMDDLASGRLVRPFDLALTSPARYWTLSLPERTDLPNIRRFRTWLLAQAEADGLRDFA
ncbi:transcriptional regulator GcvA [Phenylobacterium aquaticum]|uniref:transcriptional regulator GcvA n=1 Tax=Phenylobacterium aquaticum TaxID=1763816 RepID=UPI0026EDA917|nr:transcriptional regulator GcvA [Phenylobacterium aquaticum]